MKTSAEMPFAIHCNLRQLDPGIFSRLYLVCYRLSRAQQGVSLPDLVTEAESSLGVDEELLDGFYRSLAAAGYRRDLESLYAEYRFEISDAAIYRIAENFPKLTEKSFSAAPDHRISNIRYSLQITGLDALSFEAVDDELRSLGAS